MLQYPVYDYHIIKLRLLPTLSIETYLKFQNVFTLNLYRFFFFVKLSF